MVVEGAGWGGPTLVPFLLGGPKPGARLPRPSVTHPDDLWSRHSDHNAVYARGSGRCLHEAHAQDALLLLLPLRAPPSGVNSITLKCRRCKALCCLRKARSSASLVDHDPGGRGASCVSITGRRGRPFNLNTGPAWQPQQGGRLTSPLLTTPGLPLPAGCEHYGHFRWNRPGLRL